MNRSTFEPMRNCNRVRGRTFMMVAVVFAAFVLRAGASATLFIEEPYGKLGFFAATGHAAVYLSGVCAQTPLILRRCAPGESGVVLSRYDGVRGYDWLWAVVVFTDRGWMFALLVIN